MYWHMTFNGVLLPRDIPRKYLTLWPDLSACVGGWVCVCEGTNVYMYMYIHELLLVALYM